MKVGGSVLPKVGEGSCLGAAEGIMVNVGIVKLPLLTRTNYHEWCLIMQVSLDAHEHWM